MKKEIKQKKQDLGIFYTNSGIVNFIYDILKIWKEKEEKESGRWESQKHFPSVIDPAVGEGVFLKAALEQGFTIPKYVFGVDIDEEVKEKWVKINLLKSFGSRAELDNHFYHQNGLLPLDEDKVFRHKKGGLKEFDAIVGNPPYGGIGIDFQGKLTSENKKLLDALEKFEIFGFKKSRPKLEVSEKNGGGKHYKISLFETISITEKMEVQISEERRYYVSLPEIVKMAHGMPIEILFLERFIQLAKPGGWIAIIIPDGILTNSNSHYVREFITDKAKVEAIISLPRDAFKNVGTSAKTSILFLQKYKDQEERQKDYPVFLASIDSLDEKNFNLIKDNYKNYYNKTMSNKNLVQTTTDEKSREIVMVRVDKTLKEMMEEKPAGRLDPYHWHPSLELPEKIKYPIKYLGDYIIEIRQGDTARKNLGERYLAKGIPFLSAASLNFTGINLSKVNYISEKQNQRLSRTKIKTGDIIFGMIGEAGVGRVGYLHQKIDNANINCTVDLIRVKEISPIYIVIYLQSNFGRNQIESIKSGVGPPALNNDEIKSIKIPILSNTVQKNIESEYKKMSKYHDIAMEAKKKGDDAEFKKNIEIAEKMLKDLIVKTEAVIRGEGKDVI